MAKVSKMPKGTSVRIAQNDIDRLRIYRFRYSVLVDELHDDPPGRDDESMTVHEPVDDTSTLLYLASDDEIMGTLRLTYGMATPIPPALYKGYDLKNFNDFADSDLSLTSAWAVSARWRGTPALSVLFAAAYKMSKERNIRFDFCHCAPAQLAPYQRLGYRRYTSNFSDETGLRVPMVMLLDDVRHLKRVRSPLFRIACKYEASSATAVWFSRKFPEANQATALVEMDEDNFWVYLTQQLHEPPHSSIPLLNGLTNEEAKKVIAVGTVLTCSAGEALIRQGELGNEMFILLSGAVEVRAGNEKGRPIAQFDCGDIFGEVAFLSEVERSATVVALSDIKVLVVTQNMLCKLMKTMPEIACKVQFNLSLVLCERLASSTDTLSIEHGVAKEDFASESTTAA
ncbi:MAG: cyclic nucleotide-binding domain-containing protein [Rhodospirillaceae bacterium]|nr:cyclic nucleotide-binding domain-containing protein [Rhodospirillaceae bacterium]